MNGCRDNSELDPELEGVCFLWSEFSGCEMSLHPFCWVLGLRVSNEVQAVTRFKQS